MGYTTLPFTGVEVFPTPNSLPTTAQLGSQALTQTPFNLWLYNGTSWQIGNSQNFVASVSIATTANITLSGEQTIDGVLTSTSSVLVKNQTLGQNNGIYTSGSGAWVRRADTNTAATLESISVWVVNGTTNSNTGWSQIVSNIILGTTVITFVQTDAEATNFVDLTSNQSNIAGNKTFTGTTTLSGPVTLCNALANYITIVGAASNSEPSINVTGSDTNVNMNFTSKAAGSFNFFTATTVQQFSITHTSSAVNYISITGAVTTTSPILSTIGSDTNVSLTITPKGSGSIILSNAVNLPTLTASLPLQLNSSKNIVSSQIALTTGVTSILPVANGGTNSSTALNNNRIMISSAGEIVESAVLSNNVAMITTSGGLPSTASTTATELGYVHGVTSAIQTQLNSLVTQVNPSTSGIVIQGYQYSTPTTGNSVTMTSSTLLIHSAITILTLTIVLPATPTAGTIATVATDAAIGALTITGSIIGTLTSLAVGGHAAFQYESNTSTWFRIG